MPIVAGAVFTLAAQLSQSILSEQQQGVGLDGDGSSGFASIANSALHLILRKMLDFILCTGQEPSAVVGPENKSTITTSARFYLSPKRQPFVYLSCLAF